MNKTTKEFFEKHDQETQLPAPMQKRLDLLVALSGWQPGDGPTPGVFAKREDGNRCLWSVKWSTADGLLSPTSYLPVEFLRLDQLEAEVSDVCLRQLAKGVNIHPSVARLAAGLIKLYSNDLKNPDGWLRNMQREIQSVREVYPEFVFPYAAPSLQGTMGTGAGRLINVLFRPEWGDRQQFIHSLGGA